LANTCGGLASSEPKTDCGPGDADSSSGHPTTGGPNANHPLNPLQNPLEIGRLPRYFAGPLAARPGHPTTGGANATHPLNPAKRLNPLEIGQQRTED
jgi:hypothetical protein